MCGIVGFAHRDRSYQASRQLIGLMCDSIRHRGPDDEGILVAGPVALGMRRLSIIDLAGGHQPISNETGLLTIVYNGEVYNYRELRQGLIQRGHTFKTTSDTETILHLFEEDGPDCVKKLRGMFAFAIHDARDGSVFLARDRFGIKPLYIAERSHGIAFASELKALVAAGPNEPRIGLERARRVLRARVHPCPGIAVPRCAKAGARILAALASRARREAVRLLGSSDEHHRDAARHRRARSGMARQLGRSAPRQRRPSCCIPERRNRFVGDRLEHGPILRRDHTHLLRAISDRAPRRRMKRAWPSCSLIGTAPSLTVVDIEPNVRDLLEPIVRSLDEPHADESAIPSWVISEAIAKQYKVALAGTGGDELFAGYRRHIGLVVGDQYRRLPRQLRRMLTSVVDALPQVGGSDLAIDRLKRFTRGTEGPSWQRYLAYFTRLAWSRRQSLYSTSVRSQVRGDAASSWFDALHTRGGSFSGVRAGLYLDYKTYLPDDILALSDRISMAHSLEVRVPFVDHPFVEESSRYRIARRSEMAAQSSC